jgi:hypothetical protein
MWRNKNKKQVPDAEIDIENQPVFSIERRGSYTVVAFYTNDIGDQYVQCSLDQHQRFVDRFREKIRRISCLPDSCWSQSSNPIDRVGAP